jgi:predicted GNAT family N-acyltransferase
MNEFAVPFLSSRTAFGGSLLDADTESKNRVSIVTTLEELREIGELRYAMYVERDKKAYPFADSQSRCFLEPIDNRSLNLFAAVAGRCLAGLRLTKATLAMEDEYLSRLLAHSPIKPSEYEKVVVASRLVVGTEIHARLQTAVLLQETYRLSLLNGAETGVISTRLALVPFFTRMGFVAYGNTYTEQIAGELAVLRFDFRNRESLASIFVQIRDAVEASYELEAAQ